MLLSAATNPPRVDVNLLTLVEKINKRDLWGQGLLWGRRLEMRVATIYGKRLGVAEG